MAYNLIVTDEMDKIYDEIEDNPGIYPVNDLGWNGSNF